MLPGLQFLVRLYERAAHSPAIRLRTAFIFDVHLGTRGCRAELLLDFLERVQLDTLVLAGDIVDLWSLRRKMFWPPTHEAVWRRILSKAEGGTRVIYVPGDHDEQLRALDGAVFGNIEIHREYLHLTADRRWLLVLHGHDFDDLVDCSRWLAWLGSESYDLLLRLNRGFNFLRSTLGFPYCWRRISNSK